MVDQVIQTLKSKLAIGESKHFDKIRGQTSDKIYSWSTYRNYLHHNCYFVKWAKEKHGCKTLAQARPFVDEWLKSRQELSAYTLKLEASALAKLYGCTTKDFIKTKSRRREDITRSRGNKVRDKHFSESKNKDFVEFCKSTGLRRSEHQSLRGNQLIEKDGEYFIAVTGKGGRYREAPIIGNVEAVVARMKEAGNAFVWKTLPNGADIHGYRSEYCTSIYLANARDSNSLPKTDRYCCRGDLKGTWYDKPAMLKASQALGHNRINIIAEHYIRQ